MSPTNEFARLLNQRQYGTAMPLMEQALRHAPAESPERLTDCRPWSGNCHLWAYFDAVLDCQRLMQSLTLDPCVRIHNHRGAHDGIERGLVCTMHHDARMGAHPLDAGPQRKRIPSAV